MDKLERKCGFTLVELLVVVVIVGILAAIAVPNFVSAQTKAKVGSVKGNMRVLQMAAESFGTANGGPYATDTLNSATGCGPFLPGGSRNITGNMGTYPTNPLTGTANVPGNSGLTTAKAISNARVSAPGKCGGNTGGLTYDQADAGMSYAITGGDALGNCITGTTGKTFVLSNN